MIWIAAAVGVLAGALAGIYGAERWQRRSTPRVDIDNGRVRIRRRFLLLRDRGDR